MQFFRRRAWYLASIVVGLAAIVSDASSKQFIARGVSGHAAVVGARHQGASDEVVAAMRDRPNVEVHRGSALGAAGLIGVLGSAISFFVSRLKSEPGPRIVPVIVWTVYIGSMLITV
jgi:hypothetical protein